MKICGLICAYNEENTVNDVVSKTLNYVDKVIFVNDGSTDKTLENIQSNYSGNDRLEIISWEGNKGKGYALIQGFKKFLESDCDILVTIDADGQHDPSNINYLVLPLSPGHADMVIGTRLSKEIVYPRIRIFFNVLTSIIVLLTTGGFHPDVASGFRAYTRNCVEKIVPHLKSHDFSIELEILKATQFEGIASASVPINCKEPKKANFGKLARAYLGFAWRNKGDIVKRVLFRK